MSAQNELLIEALKRLPEEEKAAFLEAETVAPDLILKDSNPEAFLLAENGDILKAALCLANYWTERKTLFKERAFLPMDVSENGALSKQDIEYLEGGSLVLLPKDARGRPVVCSESTRSNPSLEHEESRPRVRFYFFSKVALESLGVSQREGVVVIRTLGLDGVSARALTGFRQQVERCLPVKFHSIHFCCVEGDQEARRHFARRVLPVVVQGMGKENSARTHVHIGKDPAAIFEKLKDFGFDRSAVPTTVGGTWSYAMLDAWRLRKMSKVSGQSSTAAESPLQATPPLLQFVLGVLVMLQEQKKCSLTTLLQAPRTQHILEGLLRPMSVGLEGVASLSTTTTLGKRKHSEPSILSEDERLEQLATVREENDRLAADINIKLAGRISWTLTIPARVQFALEVLAAVEEKKGCTLRGLLSDTQVQMIICGMFGTPMACALPPMP